MTQVAKTPHAVIPEVTIVVAPDEKTYNWFCDYLDMLANTHDFRYSNDGFRIVSNDAFISDRVILIRQMLWKHAQLCATFDVFGS